MALLRHELPSPGLLSNVSETDEVRVRTACVEREPDVFACRVSDSDGSRRGPYKENCLVALARGIGRDFPSLLTIILPKQSHCGP